MPLNQINNHFSSRLIDKKCNGPCLIIGSGPSSNRLDTIKEWSQYYSISCNWSQRYFPSQLYAYQDKDFLRRAKHSFLKTKCVMGLPILPTAKDSVNNFRLTEGLGGFYINRIRTAARPEWLETRDSSKLHSSCPITGNIAACIAYTMGFSPIVLIGFDCKVGEYAYGKKHFRFGFKNMRGGQKHAASQINFLSKYHEEMNIINCSQGEFAPQKDFRYVVKTLGKPNYKSNAKIIKGIYIDTLKKSNNRLWKDFENRPDVRP